MYRAIILIVLLTSSVLGHEMVPTYPVFQPSIMESVKKTRMEIFNKRSDVEWFQIVVLNKEWELLPFVTRYKILNVPHLKNVKFDVYINDKNSKQAEYICSISKLRGNDSSKPIVESRICSRFK